MATEPLREVRDHLSDYVDRAARQHERVVVTRNGRPPGPKDGDNRAPYG
jgi:antitoxin YefM